MYLHALLTLIATALTGATMGSFLLLTVLHRPLISIQLNTEQTVFLYRRFYRLNIALCLLAGLISALIENRQAALLLSILAISYIFTNMHILNAIFKHSVDLTDTQNTKVLHSLKILQNIIHFCQFTGAGWAVYYLY